MTNKQRAEEIAKDVFSQVLAKAAISVSHDPDLTMNVQLKIQNEHYAPLIKALEDSFLKGQQSILAKMPSQSQIDVASKEFCYNVKDADKLSYEAGIRWATVWLRTKLTE